MYEKLLTAFIRLLLIIISLAVLWNFLNALDEKRNEPSAYERVLETRESTQSY